jgi:hypothetical protein
MLTSKGAHKLNHKLPPNKVKANNLAHRTGKKWKLDLVSENMSSAIQLEGDSKNNQMD